jgi:hypothetical protein
MTTGNITLDKIGIDDSCLERVLRYEGAHGINVSRLNFAGSETLQKEANYLSILLGKYSAIPVKEMKFDAGIMKIIEKKIRQDKSYGFRSMGLSIENSFEEYLEAGTFKQHLKIELHSLFGEPATYNLNQIVKVSYEKGDAPAKVVLESRIKNRPFDDKSEDGKNLGAVAKAVHSAYERAVNCQERLKEIRFPRNMKW